MNLHIVIPDLTRLAKATAKRVGNPEGLQYFTGFPPEFILAKAGTGMTGWEKLTIIYEKISIKIKKISHILFSR